jgi:hypothetical protein
MTQCFCRLRNKPLQVLGIIRESFQFEMRGRDFWPQVQVNGRRAIVQDSGFNMHVQSVMVALAVIGASHWPCGPSTSAVPQTCLGSAAGAADADFMGRPRQGAT